MLEIFSSRLSNLGLVVHHKGSWEIHLLSMPRHSLGLYSGAVWPAPCKKPNSITSYFIKLQQATSNIIRNIGTLTFTVANVKLFPYSFVYLHTNFKKQSIIIENKIKIKMCWQSQAYPPTWPSTNHGLQSSETEKFKDLIHDSVPMYGSAASWSPLWEIYGPYSAFI